LYPVVRRFVRFPAIALTSTSRRILTNSHFEGHTETPPRSGNPALVVLGRALFPDRKSNCADSGIIVKTNNEVAPPGGNGVVDYASNVSGSSSYRRLGCVLLDRFRSSSTGRIDGQDVFRRRR
jgi:hypothetical protein